tara:strand:+ start:4948 stop:5289 length:342 start_codon:yes stop_codon:yes gene_type:complete
MSKLLTTRLPIATEEAVDSDTYNRLIRVLELNLGTFDPDNTRQMNQSQRNKVKFNPGGLIWNTDLGVLQVWTGYHWLDIGQRLNDFGYEAIASVGKVTVSTGGNTSIEISNNY